MKKAGWLISLFPNLLVKKRQQEQFLRKNYKKELHDVQLSSRPLHSKLFYYATWGVVSISEVFAELYRRKLTAAERRCASSLSLLYALADEMVDNINLSQSDTIEFINGKESEDSRIKWAQQLLNELNSNSKMKEQLSVAIDAQLKSSVQTTTSDLNEVRNLTYHKGSQTMFLYRLLMDPPVSNAEKEAVLQLGYTLQLADDIIDAYDDTADKINTTANLTELKEVENYFQSQIETAKKLFFRYYGNSANTRKAFLQFDLLFGISHLALKRFHKKQITHFKQTSILQHPRSTFIIDMEKPSEVLSALWMVLKA
jgi:hypothetical protein